MARNGVIGRDGDLPWRLPGDLKFFMATTLGKPVIMGRKTFETLPGPLPGRANIVVTRQPGYRAGADAGDPVVVVADFAAALRCARDLALADGGSEIMVAGGTEIYRLGLAVATRLYVTRIDLEPEGDTWFPEVDWSQWRLLDERRVDDEPGATAPYRIMLYERAEGPRSGP